MVWPEIGIGDASNTRLIGVFLAFLSAVLTALTLFMIRNPNQTESPGAIALYFVLVSMVGALVTLSPEWLMPCDWTLALLIESGLFGGFAHIAMTILSATQRQHGWPRWNISGSCGRCWQTF